MRFVISVFAIIGFLFLASIVVLNLGPYKEYRQSVRLMTDEHDCDSILKEVTWNTDETVEAKYIIYNCDSQILNRIEVTRTLGRTVIEKHSILVAIKDDVSKDTEPTIMLTAMDNDEIYVRHSNEIEIPEGEFGSFIVVTSLIDN